MYVVAKCPRCGEFLLAKIENRTRSCTSCGHRADLMTLRILGRAETTNEAIELIKHFKAKEAGEGFNLGFKKLG